MLRGWIGQWDRDNLGTWVARRRTEKEIVGFGGCSLRRDSFWNLGYRFLPSARGRGYATELSRAAVMVSWSIRPDLPVVAYMLESNNASARVAEKAGLHLVARVPSDVGDANPVAMRLVYSNRRLSAAELEAVVAA